VNVFTAVGTVGAVVWAVFGEVIRQRLNRVRLRFELESPGTWTVGGGDWSLGDDRPAKFFYRHLRVVNSSRTVASRCRALLREIWELQEDGGWKRLPMPVPFPMPWAPASLTPGEVDT
jgi:hypothetical protein